MFDTLTQKFPQDYTAAYTISTKYSCQLCIILATGYQNVGRLNRPLIILDNHIAYVLDCSRIVIVDSFQQNPADATYSVEFKNLTEQNHMKK